MTARSKLPSLFELAMSAEASAAAAKADSGRPVWPVNPFPAGIQRGSVTDRVMIELRLAYPQALNHGQLRHRCVAGRGAICWATRYLEAAGRIERLPDPRSEAYLRYRLVPGEAYGD